MQYDWNNRDSRNEFKYKASNDILLSDVQKGIIKLIMDKPNITQPQTANMLGVNERTIRNHLRVLLDSNYIIRVGSKKSGEWKVINRGDNND